MLRGFAISPYFFANRPIMLKKTPFFKKSGYQAEILPFMIFRSVMIAMQIVCIVVLLVRTFVIVLNNVGEPVLGSLGTLSRSE